MKNALLTAKDLNIWYGNHHAIKEVNLEIPASRITALIGASGSGKSTFLRAINRMLDVIPMTRFTGNIFYDTEDITEKNTDVIALRRKIGMVFQQPTPFPKSIYDNIAYGLEIQGAKKRKSNHVLHLFSTPKIKPEVLEKSTRKLDQAVVQSLKDAALWEEVKERLHLSALGLSGGQQQRLCIARMIATKPDILLLDEPCSALDPISTQKIEKLLLALKKDYTIIIVTHNMQQARRISDHVGFFHLGELIEFGETEQIFQRPKKVLTREYVRGEFG
ncbi:MAG: phosphate ABC transporter ATP-binding protein [Candidatus Levyibacteriota bacterium]